MAHAAGHMVGVDLSFPDIADTAFLMGGILDVLVIEGRREIKGSSFVGEESTMI